MDKVAFVLLFIYIFFVSLNYVNQRRKESVELLETYFKSSVPL